MSNDVDNLGRVGETDTKWRIERKVSVGVILTLILHTAGLIWFLASLNSGLTNLKEITSNMERRMSNINAKLDSMMSTEEVMRLHNYTMDRIDNLDTRVRDLEKTQYSQQK